MVNSSDTLLTTTENRILEAAKKVFIRYGLEGTSMQQIADEANINKSLLHYYFRTKQRLFTTVFSYAIGYMIPQVEIIMNSNDSIFVKIERLVSEYMDMLLENSFIPAFVIHEINRNPDGLFQIMKDSGIRPEIITDKFELEMRNGTIRRFDIRHLIINLFSLCIFPIAARPLMQRVLFKNDEIAYQQFLLERKKIVTDFIIQSIKI
jgi:TetR/AcrR family transcriptional regulator